LYLLTCLLLKFYTEYGYCVANDMYDISSLSSRTQLLSIKLNSFLSGICYVQL